MGWVVSIKLGDRTQSHPALTQVNQVSSPDRLNGNKRPVLHLVPALVVACLGAQKRQLDLSSALVCLFLAVLLPLGFLLPLVLGEVRPVETDSSQLRGSARGKVSSWQNSYF